MNYREFVHLLKTTNNIEEIKQYQSEIIRLIPQYESMIQYDQNNHYHQYDLDDHSLHTVLNLPRNLDDDMLYLAALIHDIGKPIARCKGKHEGDTESHYYGHPEISYEITRDSILPYMLEHGASLTEEEQERLLYYVLHHDDHMSLRIKHLKEHLKLVDFETFQKLMLLEVADARAHVLLPVIVSRIDICSQWAGAYGREKYHELLQEKRVN